MFRRYSVNFALLSMLIDAVSVSAALYSAVHLRPLLNTLPFTREITPPLQLPSPIYPLFSFSWVAILLLLSVYDGRRNVLITTEFTALWLGSIVAAVSLAGTLYLSYREVSRVLFITFVVIAYLLLVTWRVFFRLIFRLRNGHGHQLRQVLIAGAGPVGQRLQQQIEELPQLGLKVAGYLDDDTNKGIGNTKILGTLSAARYVIEHHQIDDVVIALPRRAYEQVNQLVADLHDRPVKVHVIPDYFHLALHKATVEDFAGIPMLDLRAPALNDFQRLFKRGFDLLLTLMALPVASILMSLAGIAIWLEGGRPVFLKQQRVGENGRVFGMLKFRTMVPEAEQLLHMVERHDEKGNVVYKTNDDPRVTRVGRFLRRTSLDELPQLYNILRGDMSLVGPRPELPYLVEQYKPWQHKRFLVPQGLTGWWQVNGRSDKPMHLHTEDDLYYIQNYSLLLDIHILVKTLWVVFRGKGAY